MLCGVRCTHTYAISGDFYIIIIIIFLFDAVRIIWLRLRFDIEHTKPRRTLRLARPRITLAIRTAHYAEHNIREAKEEKGKKKTKHKHT